MGGILDIEVTPVFEKNLDANTRFVVNQGGSSSSKTYSILQLLLGMAMERKRDISICSPTMPHLKRGALKDWINILSSVGLYNEDNHNKTDHKFTINSSTVEFFSLDMPGKVRGPRRDILYINEANLTTLEVFRQLNLRTNTRVFMDFNPSDEFHWIYDEVLTDPDCTFIQSTYKDNTFLNPAIRQQIEKLQHIDENYWRVYGLGERGTSKATVFTHWKQAHDFPRDKDGKILGQEVYGLDFGFNNPSALVRIVIHDNDIYAEEMIYRSGMHNADIIKELVDKKLERAHPIYADNARPEFIGEIYRAGFNIFPADKDVKKGIDTIKQRGFYVLNNSPNLIKELKSYKYQEDKNGHVLEEPVKLNDHLIDSVRYAAHTYLSKPAFNPDDWLN